MNLQVQFIAIHWHILDYMCTDLVPTTHSQCTDASPSKTSDACLLLSVQVEQHSKVAGSIGHHIPGQHNQVGTLLTLVTKGMTGQESRNLICSLA